MFTDDFKQTITDFEYIRPQLQKMMGGQIIGVEGTGELAQVLDMRCGIDYLLVTADGVRGIASRIQHGPPFARDADWTAQAHQRIGEVVPSVFRYYGTEYNRKEKVNAY